MHRHSYQELFDEEWLYFYFGYKAILNKIWLFLSFDYGELCCICILVIEIFDEVWLQCTLVTKYGYSLH